MSVPVASFNADQIAAAVDDNLPYNSATTTQPDADQAWTLTFTCSDENGTPTKPFTKTVTVEAASISTVAASGTT